MEVNSAHNQNMLEIPDHEIEYQFSRSSGKGGQNVNKTETRVQLRWNPGKSAILTEDQKSFLSNRLKNRLTAAGDIIVASSTERTQFANLRIAKQKLNQLVENALIRPKSRRSTRPSRAARLRRLESKRRISMKKASRRVEDS